MCIAIPMQIVEVTEDGIAKCKVGEGDTYVTANTALLSEPAVSGDYVIVHAGFALRKLEEEDALETLSLMREMAELVPFNN